MYKVNKLTQHISLAGGVEANPGKRDVSLRHESHTVNTYAYNILTCNLYVI